MQGRNSDDIAEKFSCNIYGITKGQLRQAILWQDLGHVLAEMGPQKLRVLDIGGGEGQTVIKMAECGHQIILCDPSVQMIDRAKQATEARGVSDNMQFIYCVAQDIASHLETPVDLTLFCAVLEWVVDPHNVLQTLWSALRPDGVSSLMLYNAHDLLMHNMVTGNFDYVQVGMPKKEKRAFSPDYPRNPTQVYSRLEEAGWQIMGKTDVRVPHDYLYEKHQQRDCYEALLELGTCYCHQEPYITSGHYIYVTACKPQSKDKI